MTDELEQEIQQILGDLVGKVLDHSQKRMPGEVQMYKMYIERAKQAIQALIAKECNKAKMEQLKYMEQFAQKQDIDWDFIANMIGQLELSNKENK
jgi:heterodisulfide reductase subunit B